jgi:hypothetical protein
MPSKAGIMLLEMPAAVLCVLKCPAGLLGKFTRVFKFGNIQI